MVAAVLSLHALRHACTAAGSFPRDAAQPTAAAIFNLLFLLTTTEVSTLVSPVCTAQLHSSHVTAHKLTVCIDICGIRAACSSCSSEMMHAWSAVPACTLDGGLDKSATFLLQKSAVPRTLSHIADLLTAVAGSLPRRQAAQLEAAVTAAADTALGTAGIAEAVEHNTPAGVGAAQPELTSEGQQHQQAAAEAPVSQLQRFKLLDLAISHVGRCAATVLCSDALIQSLLHFSRKSSYYEQCVDVDMLPRATVAVWEVHHCHRGCAQVVATAEMLGALSRGLLPTLERTTLLERLLRCALVRCMHAAGIK
jgi:hypothetical protein